MKRKHQLEKADVVAVESALNLQQQLISSYPWLPGFEKPLDKFIRDLRRYMNRRVRRSLLEQLKKKPTPKGQLNHEQR